MSKRPTIHTVAQEAGVSVSTVSQVLRGVGRISEETRRKVQRAAKRLEFVRDRHAVAMRSGETRDVGLLIHRIINPFNAEVVAGASAYLEEHGYLVFVLDAHDDLQLQEKYLRTVIEGLAGGLLWVPANGTSEETVEWVARHSPATVTWMRMPQGQPFDHVGIDSTYGTTLATRHLVDLGHERIAFLGGDLNSPTIMQRVGGFASVVVTGGMGTPIIHPCEESKTAAKEAVIALMAEHPDLSAIVCNCDIVAMGATLGLAHLGKEVGRDVSIIGFDDLEDSALWEPPLSSIAVDPKGLGAELARMFIARKNAPDAAVKTVQMPVQLVSRASSGPRLAKAAP